MPDRPSAPSRRRQYRLHLQIGTALSLGLVLLAFSVPAAPEAHARVRYADPLPPILLDVPQSNVTPPPPPPPLAPPPEEVSNEAEIENEIVQGFEFSLGDTTVPAGPPEAPLPPPLAPKPVHEPPPVDDVADAEDVLDFVPIEDQPVLIGGIDGLQRRVTYPEVARKVGAQGTVHVRFVVDENGRVVDPQILRSPHPALSEAALTAITESRFEPGRQRGRAVKVRLTLPVRFVIR